MLFKDVEQELLQEFPDYYQNPPKPDGDDNYENELNEDLDEKQQLLYEGGAELEDVKSVNQQKKEPVIIPARYNYAYMDGLRGLGAFSVYLCHFIQEYYPRQTKVERDDGIDVVATPAWIRYPPFMMFQSGYMWVQVFFILSGFVLPLNFFKTGRYSCLTGGVMRRYFRLMLPVLMILSIYLLFARFDCFGESTFNKIKNRTFLDLLYAALFETWVKPSVAFIEPTWTLGIELWATFLVYIVAFTAHSYRGRFFFYTALIFFFWSIEFFGFLNLIPWKTVTTFRMIPAFLVGTALADLENMVQRPLDNIRDLHWGWKIPFNGTLIILALIWGSIVYEEPEGCQTTYDKRCQIYTVASINGLLPVKFTRFASAFAIVILALTSDVIQWILKTWPIQFLGKVSYTLYLVHELIVHWCQKDTYNYMLGEGVPADEAITYIFLIYTPVLFLASWILELIVDRPAKEFAGEFDRQIRRVRPDTDKLEIPDKDEFYSCGQFSRRIWPIWGFIAWLTVLAVSIEIFNTNHQYKPMIHVKERSEAEFEASVDMPIDAQGL